MTEDKWSRWLNDERWGDYREAVQAGLNVVRDRILRMAALQPGERVVDLGAGTGLLGLEARWRVGPDGAAICIDISRDALRTALQQAAPDVAAAPSGLPDSPTTPLLARPEALVEPALSAQQSKGRAEDDARIPANVHCVAGDARHVPLADGCADAAVMRSVLIYIPDRLAAAREIARILRPGGRFAGFEPINRNMPKVVELPGFEDVEAARDAAMDLNTLTNFDEDDLVAAFRKAGFARVELEMDESRWPMRGREWAHGMRHGAPGGYSGYDMLLMGGVTPERADEFIAAGEAALGDDWRVWTCPAVYLTAVR
jgi:SAM-dependent methyltransferase